MRHFQQIASGLPVQSVIEELARNPGLWDANRDRTGTESPHAESSDIWVRYQPPAQFSDAWMKPLPHNSEFWPAWSALPSLHPLVFDVARIVEATQIGGILITRLTPGTEIKPHIDRGWHPEFYRTKAYVILQANGHCVNFAENESALMQTGSAWLFDNQVEHGVRNEGDTDRIAAIICMRTA